jgi:hypothetical protein
MDPVSMGVMLAVSTAVSAAGAMQQAQTQAYNAKAQANALDYQAQVDANNAKAATDAAGAREDQQRRQFRAMQGQAEAGIAQSNTGFEGSNADILKQNAVLNELDALTIRYEGDNRAKGLMAQSQLDQYNAQTSRDNAGRIMTGGYLNAGSQILSGATKYNYYKGTGKMPGMD